jgi:hypothetical protein
MKDDPDEVPRGGRVVDEACRESVVDDPGLRSVR